MSLVGSKFNGKRVFDSLAVFGALAAIALTSLTAALAVAGDPDSVGRNEVRPARYAGLYLTRSAYNIPGSVRAQGFNRPEACNDSRVVVRIAQGVEDAEVATHEVCRVASESLKYLDQALGRTRLRIMLDVLPPGAAASWQGRAWGFSPSIRLGVPMLRSKEVTIHNIVDLVAHEGFHIISFALGDESWSDEETAYYHGLCAQLSVLGELRREILPIYSKLETDDGAIGASLRASSKVRNEVYPLFRDRDVLPAIEGRKILSRCLDSD
ncbi:hypothetical protein [Pseudoxanthomonas mexicana]|uniref:hypothetical protein n=1 Tax=Pseudoxanthomonas mexicana TaxID=128785 RepID=UPI00398B8F5E